MYVDLDAQPQMAVALRSPIVLTGDLRYDSNLSESGEVGGVMVNSLDTHLGTK